MPSAAALPPVLLIAGPTASGKSALALELAEQLGGEIVGADSMQIYRDLRILTARPSLQEEARVPHHLIGVADGAEAWSVGRWLREARNALAEIVGRGRVAVVAGGTGLYFRALTEGLADIPEIPPSVRDAVEAEFDAQGEEVFRERLALIDPRSAASLARNDRQRLIRAMAVAAHTGAPLSEWQARTVPTLRPGSWRGLVLEPPRETLYRRCDERLHAMIAAGALDELRALLARGLAEDLPVMKAVGVRELSAHLRGEVELETALAAARQATRNYAKRQLTWFRNQTPAWPRLAGPDAEAALVALSRAP